MREVVILGSTGSIGRQALEIIEANPDKFRVIAITSAGTNPAQVIEQAKKKNTSTPKQAHSLTHTHACPLILPHSPP